MILVPNEWVVVVSHICIPSANHSWIEVSRSLSLPSVDMCLMTSHLESMQTDQFAHIRVNQLKELIIKAVGYRRCVVGMDSNIVGTLDLLADVLIDPLTDVWSDCPTETWHAERFSPGGYKCDRRYYRILIKGVAVTDRSVVAYPSLSDHDLLNCDMVTL